MSCRLLIAQDRTVSLSNSENDELWTLLHHQWTGFEQGTTSLPNVDLTRPPRHAGTLAEKNPPRRRQGRSSQTPTECTRKSPRLFRLSRDRVAQSLKHKLIGIAIFTTQTTTDSPTTPRSTLDSAPSSPHPHPSQVSRCLRWLLMKTRRWGGLRAPCRPFPRRKQTHRLQRVSAVDVLVLFVARVEGHPPTSRIGSPSSAIFSLCSSQEKLK
jgi:hypothetical protein